MEGNINNQQTTNRKPSKKPPMRTAMDVVNRILWDEQITRDHITIGYEDRFLGILEKPFTDFSWEPLDSLEFGEFGIPEHRINYFKYKSLIIWDKRIRLDRVFGSAGSNEKIEQVIAQYDANQIAPNAYQWEPIPLSEENENDAMSDDDGVVLVDKLNKSSIVADNSETDSDIGAPEDRLYWQNKLRPNFFLCLHVTDPIFVKNAEMVQKHVCSIKPELKACCIPSNVFHITLRTLRLDNAAQVSECIHVLEESQSELNNLVPSLPLLIRGLGIFNGRVLYAEVQPSEALNAFVEQLTLELRSSGLRVRDLNQFVPHVTLIKLNRPTARRLQGVQLDSSLYSSLTNEECAVGSLVLDRLYLCSMERRRDENGFYICPASFTFSPNVAS